MKRILMFVLTAAAFGILVFLIVRIAGKKTIESAIDKYEDQNYADALVVLNRLALTADYDASEKIFYYKCKSINKLAVQLEEKHDEELKDASLERKGTSAHTEAIQNINKMLQKINKKTRGDLVFIPARKKSKITSRGTFYDQFVSKFRGSSLIEDLDFEEVEKTARTEPDKAITTMLNFYGRYPGTNYISNIVKMMFDIMQKGDAAFAGKETILWDLIVAYCKRHPTSPEVNKIFTCKGDNVNLRNSPGVEGKLVGKIKKEEILVQLEKSLDTVQVGDVRDYWYRVSNLSGLRGWIFGKFLTPIDMSKYEIKTTVEKWGVEEIFDKWSDSNTPANWAHIPDANKTAISFTMQGNDRIIALNAPKGKKAGLYSRYNASLAFTIIARGRKSGGSAFTLFAYVIQPGRAFYITLRDEKVECNGRIIPLHTADWHEYRPESDNGQFCRLVIDGEVISGRIEPAASTEFLFRGIYALCSLPNEESKGEMEFIRIR